MKRTVIFASILAMLVMAPAFGAIVIDFGTGDAGVGGTFTLLSGGNAKGALIPIDALTVSGTSSHDGVYEVTGAAVDASDALGSGSLDFNTSTNTITITGGIPALGIANGTVLLTGSFAAWTASLTGLTNASGPDTKSRALLDALGISLPATSFAYFGFSLTTNNQSPDSVISTDIKNTGVPEPTSVLLLGTVLIGVTQLIRRRSRA